MDILLETLGGSSGSSLDSSAWWHSAAPLEKERVYTVIRHRRRSRSACWCSTQPRRG